MLVRWGNSLSPAFHVRNGVRQGGILSPLLFNVYMNDLSVLLNKCSTGCPVGNHKVNHLMYADDLVLISSYSGSLQSLLSVCTDYGNDFDIMYNAKKSKAMIVKSKINNQHQFPVFHLCNQQLDVVDSIKYLGHIISNDLRDDADISRQCRRLYAQGNMLKRKFFMCTPDVKLSLFRAYCTSMYTGHLWINYKKSSYDRLRVAYNDSLRIFLGIPRFLSASQMFSDLNVSNLGGILRNCSFRFMQRLESMPNDIISNIVNMPLSIFQSKFYRHWHHSLFGT